MTETEWLVCDDTPPMLEFLRGSVSERKARLFACDCCRRIWHLVPAGKLWEESLAVAERYADGGASPDELYQFYSKTLLSNATNFGTYSEPTFAAVNAVVEALQPTMVEEPPAIPSYRWQPFEDSLGSSAASAVVAEMVDGIRSSWWGRLRAGFVGFPYKRAWNAERARQADLLRDLFGNPFRPIAFLPAWRTDTTLSLARQMYDARDFSAMPILADALQDAGCDNDDVLTHCRGGGPHVRGCWVVDLLLSNAPEFVTSLGAPGA